MIKFEVNKNYDNCYIGDSQLKPQFKIISRTEKMIKFLQVVSIHHPSRTKVKSGKIHTYNDVEFFYPDGKYSMALTIPADREI